MRPVILILFCITSILFSSTSFPQDKVKLEIIDVEKSMKIVEFDWPFPDEAPVGSAKTLLSEVDKVLKKNGVDCPPKREKISDNIWKCGNGKKIRTDDPRFVKLLSKAWK